EPLASFERRKISSGLGDPLVRHRALDFAEESDHRGFAAHARGAKEGRQRSRGGAPPAALRRDLPLPSQCLNSLTCKSCEIADRPAPRPVRDHAKGELLSSELSS